MGRRKFEDEEVVSGVFYLLQGSVRTTKNGDPYWQGTFKVDKDTDLNAKMWNNKGSVQRAKAILVPNKFLRVQGKIEFFKDEPQLNISSVEEASLGDFEPSLFLKVSSFSKEAMITEFDKIVATMEDIHYKKLLETFRNDPLFEKYSVTPAAKMVHHPWISGLLEHSLTLAKAVLLLHSIYQTLNKDLLLTAAFLHDVGKVFEISSDIGFDYTLDGQLMGHIYLGAIYVEKLIERIENFPESKKKQIIHIVLSHQGYREDGFGSPVDPSTLDAVFFHHLDNLDAKMVHIMSAISENEPQKGFIKSPPPLGLKIYVGEEEKEEEKVKVKKNLYEY